MGSVYYLFITLKGKSTNYIPRTASQESKLMVHSLTSFKLTMAGLDFTENIRSQYSYIKLLVLLQMFALDVNPGLPHLSALTYPSFICSSKGFVFIN